MLYRWTTQPTMLLHRVGERTFQPCASRWWTDVDDILEPKVLGVDRFVLSAVTLDRVCEVELLRPRRATVCLSVARLVVTSLLAGLPVRALSVPCQNRRLSQRQHRLDLNSVLRLLRT